MSDDDVLARIKKADPVRKAQARHTKQILAGAAALAVCAGLTGAVVATNLTQPTNTAAPVAPPVPPANVQANESTSAQAGISDSKMATSPAWWGAGVYLTAGPGVENNVSEREGWVAVAPKDLPSVAQQLSEALGTGKVTKDEYGYTATSKKANLWVSSDAAATWSYSTTTAGCTPGSEDATMSQTAEPAQGNAGSAPSVSVEEASPANGQGQPCPAPISSADAQTQASEVLNLMQAGAVELDTFRDEYTTTVTAWQVLDGARTGVSWNFTYTDQLSWASGQLSKWEKFGTYPTVGAVTAIERSHDIKWTAFGPTPSSGGPVTALPAQARDTVSSTTPDTASQGQANTSKTQPGQVQVPFNPVQVDTAEESWAQYWTSTGQVQLLPAYTLTTKDGSWTVISVAEEAVTWTR